MQTCINLYILKSGNSEQGRILGQLVFMTGQPVSITKAEYTTLYQVIISLHHYSLMEITLSLGNSV